MVQSNQQKWRWGRQREEERGRQRGGKEEREMDESSMSLLPVLD